MQIPVIDSSPPAGSSRQIDGHPTILAGERQKSGAGHSVGEFADSYPTCLVRGNKKRLHQKDKILKTVCVKYPMIDE